jgi:hypothetical protein
VFSSFFNSDAYANDLWVMAPSVRLANFSIRRDGITEYKKLEIMSLEQ